MKNFYNLAYKKTRNCTNAIYLKSSGKYLFKIRCKWRRTLASCNFKSTIGGVWKRNKIALYRDEELHFV